MSDLPPLLAYRGLPGQGKMGGMWSRREDKGRGAKLYLKDPKGKGATLHSKRGDKSQYNRQCQCRTKSLLCQLLVNLSACSVASSCQLPGACQLCGIFVSFPETNVNFATVFYDNAPMFRLSSLICSRALFSVLHECSSARQAKSAKRLKSPILAAFQ